MYLLTTNNVMEQIHDYWLFVGSNHFIWNEVCYLNRFSVFASWWLYCTVIYYGDCSQLLDIKHPKQCTWLDESLNDLNCNNNNVCWSHQSLLFSITNKLLKRNYVNYQIYTLIEVQIHIQMHHANEVISQHDILVAESIANIQ